MSRLQKVVAAIAALSLILASAACVKAWREVQGTQRELRAMTSANDFLRKTLGEMTAAIAAKDTQIDRLERSGCNSLQQEQPRVPVRPEASKSNAAWIRPRMNTNEHESQRTAR